MEFDGTSVIKRLRVRSTRVIARGYSTRVITRRLSARSSVDLCVDLHVIAAHAVPHDDGGRHTYVCRPCDA